VVVVADQVEGVLVGQHVRICASVNAEVLPEQGGGDVHRLGRIRHVAGRLGQVVEEAQPTLGFHPPHGLVPQAPFGQHLRGGLDHKRHHPDGLPRPSARGE
jgi:hypothetical protein